MRPLVMDFPTAGALTAVDDQYMFGPALMVSPVTAYKVRERTVYLPPTQGGWYDFWTGGHVPPGAATVARAVRRHPDSRPRGGSIIPFGPELQYTDEKPADPITLFVYAGQRRRVHALRGRRRQPRLRAGRLRDDSASLARRQPDADHRQARREPSRACSARRTFQVVLVAKDRAVPFSFSPTPDKTVAMRARR